MLTTHDKLIRKPNEIGHIQFEQEFSSLDYTAMIASGNPYRYITSLFYGTTLEEEMKQPNEKTGSVDHSEKYPMGTYIIWELYLNYLYYVVNFVMWSFYFFIPRRKIYYQTVNYLFLFVEDMSEIIATRVICPEFHGFVAKKDKNKIDSEIKLEGIEHRFDPDIHQFQSLTDSKIEVESHTVTGILFILI